MKRIESLEEQLKSKDKIETKNLLLQKQLEVASNNASMLEKKIVDQKERISRQKNQIERLTTYQLQFKEIEKEIIEKMKEIEELDEIKKQNQRLELENLKLKEQISIFFFFSSFFFFFFFLTFKQKKMEKLSTSSPLTTTILKTTSLLSRNNIIN